MFMVQVASEATQKQEMQAIIPQMDIWLRKAMHSNIKLCAIGKNN